MKNQGKLDELLDQALSEYRDAEPLNGFEDHVPRRLAAQRARNRRR